MNEEIKEKVTIEICRNSITGEYLVIDNYRVSGNKPYGISNVLKKWVANKEDIKRALGIL